MFFIGDTSCPSGIEIFKLSPGKVFDQLTVFRKMGLTSVQDLRDDRLGIDAHTWKSSMSELW